MNHENNKAVKDRDRRRDQNLQDTERINGSRHPSRFALGAFLKRRDFWCRLAAVAGCLPTANPNALPSGQSPLNCFNLGAISDSFTEDFAESLRIMKGYGLSWVEIRSVYGVYNTEASAAQIKQLKEAVDRYGFRVSVIDSAVYKCALPGTRPIRGDKVKFDYPQQIELLKRAIDRADRLGSEKIRAFTFWRVPQPKELQNRIAEELGKAAEIAGQAGKRLVIENEESCNAATAREMADILALTPAKNLGVNWDIGNGFWEKEISFPDGYGALDKGRVWHMHLKDVRCGPNLTGCSETMARHGQVDLVGQFRQLLKDGYQGTMSLECEVSAPGQSHLDTSKRSLEGLLTAMRTAVGDHVC